MYLAFFLETDEYNTLGGSHIRDLYNLAHALSQNNKDGNKHVFTHKNLTFEEK